MPRVGRALREQMRDAALETPARVLERIAHRRAMDEANRELPTAFPEITGENAREVVEWLEKRVAELKTLPVECAWCGADIGEEGVMPRPNGRGEVFCSTSHRSSSERALRRLLASGAS